MVGLAWQSVVSARNRWPIVAFCSANDVPSPRPARRPSLRVCGDGRAANRGVLDPISRAIGSFCTRFPETRKPGRRKLNARGPGCFAPRPPGPAQADVTTQRLFRRGLKALASEGSFLLQVLADGDQLIVADTLFEPRPAGFGPEHWRIAHRDEAGLRRHQRIFAKCRVGLHARPVVVPRFPIPPTELRQHTCISGRRQ